MIEFVVAVLAAAAGFLLRPLAIRTATRAHRWWSMGEVERRVMKESRRFRKALPRLLHGPYHGRWVIFLHGKVQGDFDDLTTAHRAALKRYGIDGGFCINRVVEGGAWALYNEAR